ncbi:MAG: thioredoxin family protein [Bacteroidetes bacterium]|nr:thioredoxin family protein [Bacteroidota bacterium]
MNRQITKARLRKEISNMTLSLVHFKTDWSGACQIISPVYEELAKSYKGTANFFSIDVEKEKGVDADFGVTEYPTILFFRNGQIIDHVIGLTPKNVLITKIKNALSITN